MRTIKASSYLVNIGENALSQFDFSSYSKISIIVDENTSRLCLKILIKKNCLLKDSLIIKIKSGEEYKTIKTCLSIWKQLTENNFDRDSLLINLGGGVIGDIGGFCASTYKRGIDFVQIPTSLLAMTDASVGGKSGIDFIGFKNQIGIFNNPKSVLIYPAFLNTLSDKKLKSGFAEVLKHALIANIKLWKKLKSTHFDKLDWEEIIYTSVEIKKSIVQSDPLEKGDRKKLNFGHTFGHAIESYYLEKKKPILHGDAIFMGILLESEMSNITAIEKIEIKKFILANFDLPNLPAKKELIKFIKNDKKNKDCKISFSLLKNIGDCTTNNLFQLDEL